MKHVAWMALPVALTAAVGCSSGGNTVSREDFGDEWPLTVDEGVIACEVHGIAKPATFTSGGKTYALNGAASSRGAADIDAIWANDPEYPNLNPPLKKDLSPLTFRALELCE